MITDPEQIEPDHESDSCQVAKGTSVGNLRVNWRSICGNWSSSFLIGCRIVMNVTDMKKLMEMNHDH